MACSPDGLICSMDTPLYPGRRKAQRLIPGQAQICSALLQPLRLFILLWRPSWLSYFTNATFPKAFQTAQNFLQLGNKKVAKEFFSRASYSVGFRVKKSFFLPRWEKRMTVSNCMADCVLKWSSFVIDRTWHVFLLLLGKNKVLKGRTN